MGARNGDAVTADEADWSKVDTAEVPNWSRTDDRCEYKQSTYASVPRNVSPTSQHRLEQTRRMAGGSPSIFVVAQCLAKQSDFVISWSEGLSSFAHA